MPSIGGLKHKRVCLHKPFCVGTRGTEEVAPVGLQLRGEGTPSFGSV